MANVFRFDQGRRRPRNPLGDLTDPMDDLWRSLRVGDRVCIVALPQEYAFAPDQYRLHEETRELYEHLIAERAVLTVNEIDDWDAPWIDYTWVREDGTEEFHSLALNHDGLERVS